MYQQAVKRFTRKNATNNNRAPLNKPDARFNGGTKKLLKMIN